MATRSETKNDRWFRKVKILTIIFWILAFAFCIWIDSSFAESHNEIYGFRGLLESLCSSFFATIVFYFLCGLFGSFVDWLKKPLSIHIDKF